MYVCGLISFADTQLCIVNCLGIQVLAVPPKRGEQHLGGKSRVALAITTTIGVDDCHRLEDGVVYFFL